MPVMGVAVSSCFFSGGCYGTEGKTRSQDLSVRGLVHLPELSELRQMSFAYYNANPTGKSVGDCTIRALSKALGQSWEETYVGLALQGFRLGDMPNADSVWGPYLREHGFTRRLLPDTECCAVAGKDAASAWAVMDELMETLRVVKQRTYDSVMRKMERL